METAIGTKAFVSQLNFRNAESTASIPPGSPVVFVMNGTEDGFGAVLPKTATGTKCPFLFAGVNVEPISLIANDFGRAQVAGLVNYAIVVQQSRVASTNSWASAQSLAIGAALSIDTVNNAFATMASTQQVATGTATSDTIAFNQFNGAPPGAVLCQTLASIASSASTTSDVRVAITAGLKVFLRMF